MANEDDQHTKFIQVIRDLVKQDNELREKYSVGEKFRFVKERLVGLLTHLEKNQSIAKTEEMKKNVEITADDVVVFVYLFKSQGNLLKNWGSMLTSKVFYEHSVNRPIYTDKSQIEMLVRSKPNKLHHAYISVSVKRSDILTSPANVGLKDVQGNPLIKVKEGSLLFNRMVAFTHNDTDYSVEESGDIVRKN